MKRLLLIAVFAAIGCGGGTPKQGPMVPQQAAPASAPKPPPKLTAMEINTKLYGKPKAQVMELLGRPTGTFSGGWKYNDGAWNEDTQKLAALWVWFDEDGLVLQCK